MKKILFILLAAALVFALGSCGEKAEEEAGADIDTKAALEAIHEKAKELAGEGAFFPFTLPLDAPINAENCQSHLGISPEDLDKYVTESYSLVAAIMAQAFDLALVKCNDYASAKEVKKLIAEGFDPAQRICAVSEVAFVVESGRFVLLGGVAKDTAEAFQKAFGEQFETAAGEVNTFYERGDDVPEGGGLGGGLILE